jgi:hypothetical protein
MFTHSFFCKVSILPIKPENHHRYPPRKEWLKIRESILKRTNLMMFFILPKPFNAFIFSSENVIFI